MVILANSRDGKLVLIPVVLFITSLVLQNWINYILPIGIVAGFLFVLALRFWRGAPEMSRTISSCISMTVTGGLLSPLIWNPMTPGSIVYAPLALILMVTDVRMWDGYLKRDARPPKMPSATSQ